MEKDKRIPKSFKIYLIIILILIVVLINPNTRTGIFSIFKSLGTSEKELELIKKIDIDNDIKRLHLYDQQIIEWKDNSISFLDFNGTEIFKKDFKFKEPDIFFGEEIIYVMDKSSGNIYLLDKMGETIERLDLKTSFHKLKEDGENIVIYRKEEDKEIVDVIDRKGNLLKTHQENIPILTLAIKDKTIDYLISTLDVDKALKSVISSYSQNGEEIFTLDIKDEVVIYSEFIKNDILIATDRGIYFLDKGKIKWKKKYEELKDVKLIDDEIYLLYKNKFEILNLKGDIKKEIVLSVPVENILLINNDPILFNKNNIIMPGKNKNILNFKTKEDILDIKNNTENLFIFKQDKLEIFKIKKKGE